MKKGINLAACKSICVESLQDEVGAGEVGGRDGLEVRVVLSRDAGYKASSSLTTILLYKDRAVLEFGSEMTTYQTAVIPPHLEIGDTPEGLKQSRTELFQQREEARRSGSNRGHRGQLGPGGPRLVHQLSLLCVSVGVVLELGQAEEGAGGDRLGVRVGCVGRDELRRRRLRHLFHDGVFRPHKALRDVVARLWRDVVVREGGGRHCLAVQHL